uniref:Uncharacterized protein n=1 Tax=Arundo donax TaxID=35708 RepID=A0A0A9DNJ0_ARUDO
MTTWTRPSCPTSASACSASRPLSETTSESTRNDAMLAPTSGGNCSEMSALAPRYSKRKSMRVYQMTLWSTTICTMRDPEKSPYMARSSGMPMTSVLGSVEREKSVMVQSREAAPAPRR